MRKTLALALLPLALAACGKASEDAPAAASTTITAAPTATTAQPASPTGNEAPTLTAVPTTATTEAPAPTISESVEAKAQKVLDRYTSKYADVLADLEAAGMPVTTKDISQEIADACATGPDGISDDEQGNAFAMMILSPVLADHGFGWVEFMKDTAKVNLELQALAGC
jgi:hypothetical protein